MYSAAGYLLLLNFYSPDRGTKSIPLSTHAVQKVARLLEKLLSFAYWHA
jgi:hypothetical protein